MRRMGVIVESCMWPPGLVDAGQLDAIDRHLPLVALAVRRLADDEGGADQAGADIEVIPIEALQVDAEIELLARPVALVLDLAVPGQLQAHVLALPVADISHL